MDQWRLIIDEFGEERCSRSKEARLGWLGFREEGAGGWGVDGGGWMDVKWVVRGDLVIDLSGECRVSGDVVDNIMWDVCAAGKGAATIRITATFWYRNYRNVYEIRC